LFLSQFAKATASDVDASQIPKYPRSLKDGSSSGTHDGTVA
jgi:hypothetical protein